MLRILFLSLFLVSITTYSQSPEKITGNWLMFFNQTRLSERWGFQTDIQFRSYEIIPNLEQLLLRGGVNYYLSNQAFASIGYAHISNYAFDKELMRGALVTENRMWQQFLIRHSLGVVFFEHRYRLEQRWINGNQNQYRDRIRYFLRTTVPINNKKVEANTVFISVYDEIFMHFEDVPFDRNRFYAAVGYQFTPMLGIQLGYLAQTVGPITKSYVQVGVFYNMDLRKTE